MSYINEVLCTEELLEQITIIENYNIYNNENNRLNALLELYGLLQNTLKTFKKIDKNIVVEIKSSMPLYDCLSDNVIIYCEISTFNPHINIYHSYAEHMNNVSDALYFYEQNRQCQDALIEQNRIAHCIDEIQLESDKNRLKIKNTIPFENVRINEEYKNKIILSNTTIHDYIMEFLDIYTYTDRADGYYSYLYKQKEVEDIILTFS
jgi:hypothetical protein